MIAQFQQAQIAVHDPVSGRVIATVPDMDADAVARAAARGRAAQPAWAELGFEGRGRVLRRMRTWMLHNAKRVTATIVSETGKAYEDAQVGELAYGVSAFGFWAAKAPRYLADERVRSVSMFVRGRRLVLHRRPIGLVGVIGPWNYPLTNSFGDCIPALAAGNSVLLKPSEVTPLTSLLLAEGLRECGLPDDVLQVMTGGGATGSAVVENVDMIMFTGSTASGREVAQAAARRLIPCSLELGGNDPMIVLADANVQRAANVATYYAMHNCGQACVSIERVYVEEPVYDQFVAAVAAKVAALRYGSPGAGPGTVDVGAMTVASQVDLVERHVADAVAAGARAVVGGHRGTGQFYAPTVLVDVDNSMEIMREETFGPTLPIMKVRDADEAVRLANDSAYGLGASVFTADVARGEAIARRLHAGSVNVNDAVISYFALELPMGGVKASGIGSRHGPGGIRKYTTEQAILVTPRLAPSREPHMYPYSGAWSRWLGRGLRLLYGRRG